MVAGTVRLGSPIEPEPACVTVGCGGGEGGRYCRYRDGTTEPVNVCTWVPLSPAALQETSGQMSLQISSHTVLLKNVEGKSEMAAKPTSCDKDCTDVASGSVTMTSLYVGNFVWVEAAHKDLQFIVM